MKKGWVIAVSLFVLLTIGGCSCGKKSDNPSNEDGNSEQENLYLITEENVIKDQEVNGIKITNVSLLMDDGIAKFQCTVTNSSEETKVIEEFKIVFKDKDGKEIYTQDYALDVLTKGANEIISFKTDGAAISKATSVEYKIK